MQHMMPRIQEMQAKTKVLEVLEIYQVNSKDYKITAEAPGLH